MKKKETLGEALRKFNRSKEDAKEDRVNAKKNHMSLDQYKRSSIDKRNDLKGARKMMRKDNQRGR